MNLRDLRYLLALAEHEHFGRAANGLRRQPADPVGADPQAGRPGGRGAVRARQQTAAPTSACLQLIDHARAAVVSAETLLSTARPLRDPLAGRFRLGIIPTLAPYLLPCWSSPRYARPCRPWSWSRGRTRPSRCWSACAPTSWTRRSWPPTFRARTC
ncbi:hypothetical protein ACRAWD_29385 [Caulobacter segnis]